MSTDPNKQDLYALMARLHNTVPPSEASQVRMKEAGWIEASGNVTEVGLAAIEHALSYGVNYTKERIVANREYEYFKPVNTLQQDLFLLAKNHYGHHIDRLQAAAIIVSQHVMVALEHIKLDSILHWLMKEFVEPGIILKNFDQMNRFLMGAGSWPHHRQSYHATLVRGLLDQIMLMRVIDDAGASLVPFDIPQKDTLMAKLLQNPA